MSKRIIVLSGMPASGKDTITTSLVSDSSDFVLLKKIKGTDLSCKLKTTYINISKEKFKLLIKENQFIQWHKRYGNYYGISKETLFSLLDNNKIPIIHIGRIENYFSFLNWLEKNKFTQEIEIIHILLWNYKDVLKTRILNREKSKKEVNKRLKAMEEEFSDITTLILDNKIPYDAVIKNDKIQVTVSTIKKIINNHSYKDDFKELKQYLLCMN